MSNVLQKHRIITWFASNPVVANILMFSILGWGIVTGINMRKEAFPAFAAESVRVIVPFQGGTPEDVESCLLYTSPSPRDS